jgi:hypothetical protein
MDAPPKLTENGLCRFNNLAHYDAGFTERPSHHPFIRKQSTSQITIFADIDLNQSALIDKNSHFFTMSERF